MSQKWVSPSKALELSEKFSRNDAMQHYFEKWGNFVAKHDGNQLMDDFKVHHDAFEADYFAGVGPMVRMTTEMLAPDRIQDCMAYVD